MSNESSVVVEWNGEQQRFTAPNEVTIGRDLASTIVLTDPSVSRHHAALRYDGDSWVLHDVSSQGRTFVDGAPQRQYRVCTPTTVVLGDPTDGQQVRVLPAAAPEPATVLGADRPGGQLVEEPHEAATVLPGPSIHLSMGGTSVTLTPGQTAVIGRDRSSDLVSATASVSRHHARVSHDGQGWKLEDLGSTGGTHVDGARVSTVTLDGTTTVTLGDAAAGERLVATVEGVPAPMPVLRPLPAPLPAPVQLPAPQPAAAWQRPQVRVLAAVMACLLVVVGAFAIFKSSGSSAPSNAELARSTVKVIVPFGTGSGSVIDAEKGLILTNAHVVAPKALGQGLGVGSQDLQPDPAWIEIAVADGLERAAEPMFEAKVVAVDGYLDLAVVQITTTLSGAVVEATDLARLHAVEIGNSDDLKTGDEVRVMGFPGVSQSDAATMTKGPVEGVVADPRLDTNRAYLNVQAPIEPGNSGGMAVDSQGRLVGVPTLNHFDFEGGNDPTSPKLQSKLGSMRPINLAQKLIAAAQAGTGYESPFVQRLTGDEQLTDFVAVSPVTTEGFAADCTKANTVKTEAGDTVLSFAFSYSGFASDAHQDVAFVLVDDKADAAIGIESTSDQYPFRWHASGTACVTMPLDKALKAGASYSLYLFAGPNSEPIGDGPLVGHFTVKS